jgi:hypothetical protein
MNPTYTTEDIAFSTIKKDLRRRFDDMLDRSKSPGHALLVVKYDRDEIWNAYINAFPEEERQGHNCNCCKSFIRQVGAIVLLKPDLTLTSVWDENSPSPGVRGLAAYIKDRPIAGLFFHDSVTAGTDKNLDKVRNVVWQHFHAPVPKELVNDEKKGNVLGKKSAELRETKNVLERGCKEITDEAIDTVLELIAQGSLYRGNEKEAAVKAFRDIRRAYHEIVAAKKHPLEWKRTRLCWYHAVTTSPAVCRLRNDVIGTLLVDLSEGKELEHALKSYETKVAPTNYKRPTAAVTPRMVEQAKKRLEELGLLSALERRRLDERDLTVANALYVYRPQTKTKDVFAALVSDAPVAVQTLSKVEEIGIEDFLKKVVPTAKDIRVLVERNHLGNFVTLTGPQDPEANNLMKWDNSFAWSYSGGLGDSLKARVAALGGRVDGVLRFSHSWNHDGQNQSLMDLHVFFPGHTSSAKPKADGKEVHNTYGSGRRVGWNHRNDSQSGANQDVDHTAEPGDKVPVENITFPDLKRMPEGVYTFKIHNWQARQPNRSGFEAEIEFGGQTYQYFRKEAVGHHEWITLAQVELKDGQFTMKHIATPASADVSKWGLTTNRWTRVRAITLSPNHWTRPIGNKHFMFMLEGCTSDEATRPFLPEHLTDELAKDRKVTEALGGKIEVANAQGAELSGLGFSDTQRNHLYIEVEGAFKRTLKVLF